MNNTPRFKNLDAVRGESFSGIRGVLSYVEDYGKAFNEEMRQIFKS
ncbi:MAG: hypothetical protein CEO12_477 [Parcubacteria group bacterium Gr01-1014_46]|nr:MAG: hypothetical protein CEO12_477 [Parcubacteria group bacterium Gr01-1014_46]